MKSTLIYVVRHGETDWNLKGKQQGHMDSPLEELAKLHTGRTILIVAHGGVLNGLFYKSISIPLPEPRRFSLFNAAINSFSICGDSWHLDTWGEIAHLQGLNTLDDN